MLLFFYSIPPGLPHSYFMLEVHSSFSCCWVKVVIKHSKDIYRGCDEPLAAGGEAVGVLANQSSDVGPACFRARCSFVSWSILMSNFGFSLASFSSDHESDGQP